MKRVIEQILEQVGLSGIETKVLPGATSSLVVRAGDSVIRIHTNPNWLQQEQDLVAHEVFALKTAGPLAPRVLKYQEAWIGEIPPWLQMTYVQGVVQFTPLDDLYVERLARTLVAIHRLPVPKTSYVYKPYSKTRVVPTWATEIAAWDWASATAPAPSEHIRFIHRDFHPVNVLYDLGEKYNVVDWVSACVGPIEADVAHCRLNLALLESVEVADRFLTFYQAMSGLTYDRRWDLNAVFDFGPETITVYPGWEAYGKRNLSQDNVRKRLENFVLKVYENNESGY
ncbi:aminoglycoside phosphotransferase family protein [Exiguobacterium sp. ERU656]|uniref:phosphotransferase family protein n=1 Tax=Exiguobacterium sp. ERU656 TaxID=2751217 RepID=UPI001BE97F53|nr:aminoglycoside phosphotransferase family protein [Exiguobacterium sp. ERU656]